MVSFVLVLRGVGLVNSSVRHPPPSDDDGYVMVMIVVAYVHDGALCSSWRPNYPASSMCGRAGSTHVHVF